jgi:hypothetical protein
MVSNNVGGIDCGLLFFFLILVLLFTGCGTGLLGGVETDDRCRC